MKDLLSNIKESLEQGISYLKGVYILQDPDRIPRYTQFPIVVLSAGPIEPGEHAGGRIDRLFVDFAIIQKIYTDNTEDKPVMGTPKQIGVLDIHEDVQDQMETEEFDGAYHRSRFEGAEAPEMFPINDSNHMHIMTSRRSWNKAQSYTRKG